MKHAKKHKKSSKSKKKSKKSDRKEKKQKTKEKLKRDKTLKATQKTTPLITVSKEEVTVNQIQDDDEFCGPSIDLMNKAKCPETKAEYDHRQSKIKRVVDPETGRIRLIKGDGEVLEEIVPRDRHIQINKEATRGDGETYQRNTVGALRK